VPLHENDITRKFNSTKIIIPVLIGLVVSGLLLYYNLSEVRYERVEDGQGVYEWVDANSDNEVQLSDSNEFKLVDNGNYRLVTYEQLLQRVNWTIYTLFWLLLAVGMVFLRGFMYMYRLRALTDKELTWKQSFNVVAVWEFASSLTPGVVGGAALAMFILNREKIALGKASALVMVITMFDNLFFLLMIPVVYLAIGSSTFFPPISGAAVLGIEWSVEGLFWLAYSLIFFFFLVLFVGLLIKPALVKRLLAFVFSFPVIRKWKSKAIKTGEELTLASENLKGKSLSFWLKPFIATSIAWTGRFLLINFIIQGFVSLGLSDHVKLYARELGMWVLMLVSPTPGGSGVAEYSFTIFLGEYIPVGTAILFAILWRLISYYPYLFLGAIILPRWIQRTKK
jgi:glycosyltransferase 2 family protein